MRPPLTPNTQYHPTGEPADDAPSATREAGEVLATYIGYLLEALWILAAVSVPLAVAPSDTMLSNIQIPKVALLRSLVCIMTMLWLLEWMVRPSSIRALLPGPGSLGIVARLRNDPAYLVLLALTLCLLVIILSTIASVSPNISIWGASSSGDSYGLYNMLSYAALFLIVATHLKRQSQLWRLLAAIVATGMTVGAFCILQRLGLDPVLADNTALDRTYATMGNPIFAGAFLLMTITMTLAGSYIILSISASRWPVVVIILALAVQISGVILTLSRGSWIGLAFGAGLFLTSIWVIFGYRRVASFGLTVLLALVLSVGIIVGIGRLMMTEEVDEAQEGSPTQVVGQRALSIVPEIVTGGISGRSDIWSGSLQLIWERPWSDVTVDRASWARQMLGYGPDLFRYVYPLRSPPRPVARFPFTAHNFPLHVGVELGALGLLSLIIAAAAVFVVGVKRLLIPPEVSPLYRILLAGILATLAGRGLEMMAGIPKAGDMTLLAILLAMFIGILRIDRTRIIHGMTHRQVEQIRAPTRTSWSEWGWMLSRATLVLCAVVALGVFASTRAISYARAGAIGSQGLSLFDKGEEPPGILKMQRAANLARNSNEYYLYMSRMFGDLASSATAQDSKLRFSGGAYHFSREALGTNELDPGARATMANAAIGLGLLDVDGKFEEAIELTEGVLAMMPNFTASHYAAALPHLLTGDVEQGLRHVEAGDALFDPSNDPSTAAEGAFLRGISHRLVGDTTSAVDAFNESLELDADGRYASTASRHLEELYETTGDEE